jgi:ABC-type transport system substrate-binding protein
MKVFQRKAISTSTTVAVIVVILVIAGVAAYFVLVPSTSTTTSSTTTSATTVTSTSTSQATTSTSITSTSTSTSTTTSSAPEVPLTVADCVAAISGTPLANETFSYTGQNYDTAVTPTPPTTGTGQYGPSNSSQLTDESGEVPPDALDPAYAFYSQDTYFINAVYNNLVEMNMTSNTVVVPVLASYYGISNGGCTNWFHLRPNVEFSNGDTFTAYDQWFSIVRTNIMNGPSGISTSNWNLVSYNNTAGGPFSSGSYSYSLGYQIPWGLRVAIQSATGLQTEADTPAAVTLAVNVLQNMLSNFNPANSTQDAIMAYPNQAYVATNSTLFVANYLSSLGPLGPLWWAGFDGQQPVDPAFVDSTCASSSGPAVEFNTLCATYDTSGGIGTGPYYIASVGSSMTPIVLKANPHYFASQPGVTGVPEIARPPSISTIIYSPWTTDSQAVGDFGSNIAQLSFEAPFKYGSMYSALPADVRQHFNFNQVFYGSGGYDFSLFGQFNTQEYPTNNTDFRIGIADALNYTAYNIPNIYNGTAYYSEYAGPLTSVYSPYYLGCNQSPAPTPCYPVPAMNSTAAWNAFNNFGYQTDTYMIIPQTFTLSNGTTVQSGTYLGDHCSTCSQPPVFKFYYTLPLTAAGEVQNTVIIQSLGVFGISATAVGEPSSVFDVLDGSPSTFPPMQLIGWGSDFDDPFYTQLFPTIGYPSPYNGWFTNSTVNQEAVACAFPATPAQVTACDNTLYAYTAQNQIFWYAPVPVTNYFFVQPYVQGLIDNQFVGVFYNQLYYSPVNV